MRQRFLMLVLLAVPLVAHAQPRDTDPQPQAGSNEPGTCPYGMGPGMMGQGMGMMGQGMGMMGPGMGMTGDDGGTMGPGMMGFGHVYALDLTDKQRAQISEIQGDLIKPMWDLARKVDEQRAQLFEAYAADTVDPKRVRVISGNIGQLHQQIAELRAKAHNEMMKVLTKDQREQLSNMRRGMWGGQGMGGPGMMSRRPSTR